MKAHILYGISDLRYEETERPIPEENMVLISVKAAGICGSDIPRIYKTGMYSFPLIPGHEFAGVVEEIGEGVDNKWLHKRVGIFPLIPCTQCESCKKKQYEMCNNYNYLGSRTNGGFAEYVCVPEWNLIELPNEVTLEQAAMLEPMSVAVHAIRKSKVKETDSVLVCGLGTIGLFIVMFLQEIGCKNIYVIGNKDFQKQIVCGLGVEETNFYDGRNNMPEEWLMEKTNGVGIDVFFECVGKNETIEQGIRMVAPGGTIQLVGNPASDMSFSKDIYWKILRKQVSVLGTWNSSFTHDKSDDWNYVLLCLQKKAIRPEQVITHRFLLEDLSKGLELMRDKSEDYVKVMITGERW